MTAKQAAAKTRAAIKAAGVNPKGMVRIVKSDYTTEVEVDLLGIYGECRLDIESAINGIGYSDLFSWNVN